MRRKYYKRIFYIIAVEFDAFLQSEHPVLYARVVHLAHQLLQDGEVTTEVNVFWTLGYSDEPRFHPPPPSHNCVEKHFSLDPKFRVLKERDFDDAWLG